MIHAPDVVLVTVVNRGSVRRLQCAATPVPDDQEILALDVCVAACIDDAEFGAGPDCVAIDLSGSCLRGTPGPLAEALLEFLANRGVRMART